MQASEASIFCFRATLSTSRAKNAGTTKRCAARLRFSGERWRNIPGRRLRSTGRRRRLNLGNALLRLGERESGTARLEQAVAAYRAALQEWTRERVPLAWAAAQADLGAALANARGAGERDGAARGGGGRLSRRARGADARAGSARLGGDAEWVSALRSRPRRARERDGAV